MPVLDRFLRYVQLDTQADESSTSYPSTSTQLVLLRSLVDELRAIGLDDATIDEYGYVMATIPATTTKPDVPVIGFIAHVDTSPEMPGAGVKPIVHKAWDGKDIVLPDAPDASFGCADNPGSRRTDRPRHRHRVWQTLLGADNKAGVAEIVTAAEYLVRHPDVPHGAYPNRVHARRRGRARHCAFRREEVRRLLRLHHGWRRRGEVEIESFSADAMTFTFHGFNTHPGYAQGRMVNAIKVAADFIDSLPQHTLSPETTERP